MPLSRQPVARHVLRHGRDDHPVRKLQARAGRAAGTSAAALQRAPRIARASQRSYSSTKRTITQFQILMPDSLAAGEKAVSELPRRQARMARDVLEPFHAVARSALQLQNLDTALLLVSRERAPSSVAPATWRARLIPSSIASLVPGTDGEVSRVCRIPDQCKLAVVPSLAQDAMKIQPRSMLQVRSVALQSVATKIASEELLAELDRVARVGCDQDHAPSRSLRASRR